MIFLCSLHKQSFSVVNLTGDTIFMQCPVCEQVQGNITSFSDTISTIKDQLDAQTAAQAEVKQ